MGSQQRIGAVLLAALVLNLGWLWIPLGVAALAVASWAAWRLLDGHMPAWARVPLLVAIWLPLLAVIVASGVTIGTSDEVLFTFGGTTDSNLFRALTGLVVPALVVGLVAWRWAGWPRKLAVAAIASWLVLTPAAVLIGYELGPEDLEAEDPVAFAAEHEVGPLAELLVIAPFVLSYGLTVACTIPLLRGEAEPAASKPGGSGSSG